MSYEVVTSAGHVLALVGNLEDARDFQDLMERKFNAQGFRRPREYPYRLVTLRATHSLSRPLPPGPDNSVT